MPSLAEEAEGPTGRCSIFVSLLILVIFFPLHTPCPALRRSLGSLFSLIVSGGARLSGRRPFCSFPLPSSGSEIMPGAPPGLAGFCCCRVQRPRLLLRAGTHCAEIGLGRENNHRGFGRLSKEWRWGAFLGPLTFSFFLLLTRPATWRGTTRRCVARAAAAARSAAQRRTIIRAAEDSYGPFNNERTSRRARRVLRGQSPSMMSRRREHLLGRARSEVAAVYNTTCPAGTPVCRIARLARTVVAPVSEDRSKKNK